MIKLLPILLYTTMEWYMLAVVLLMAVVVLLIAAIAFYVIIAVKAFLGVEKEEKEKVKRSPLRAIWQDLNKILTNPVPIEKEQDVMLNHDYDGIQELDNHLPPWWVAMFGISIVFAAVYLLNYHVLKLSPLSEGEYRRDMKEAKLAVERYKRLNPVNITPENVKNLQDNAEAMANGKAIFIKNCAQCHQQDGGGDIGPNLTDKYWLHGGDLGSIYNTISEGVVEKGMISWKNQLKPEEMQDVANYIYSLEGTKPANPKEPQGEVFERE